MQKKINLTESLKKLEGIAQWFQSKDEVDVEEGLKKIKEGAEIIKESKKRLREIENEFSEVKKGIEDEDE